MCRPGVAADAKVRNLAFITRPVWGGSYYSLQAAVTEPQGKCGKNGIFKNLGCDEGSLFASQLALSCLLATGGAHGQQSVE